MNARTTPAIFRDRGLLFLLLWALFANSLWASPERISIEGQTYVALRTVASELGMDTAHAPDGKRLELKSKWTSAKFEAQSPQMTLNGVAVHLGEPVVKRGSQFYMSETDYRTAVRPLLTPQIFPNPPALKVIVLDAGHGGKDDGAQNARLGLKEKTLALDLARRLKALLEQKGYKVYLTRKDDTFIELDQRPAIAARQGADLFISLHFNASVANSVAGVETYVLTPSGHASTSGGGRKNETHPGNAHDPWSALIGYYAQRELVGQLKAADRGLKHARFAVLRTLKCPGLLVEGGFISNDREGRSVGSPAYRQKIAVAIADAVSAYDKTLQRVRDQQQKKK